MRTRALQRRSRVLLAHVRVPPWAVGFILHPVTFGGQYVGPWLRLLALRWKCPTIKAGSESRAKI